MFSSDIDSRVAQNNNVVILVVVAFICFNEVVQYAGPVPPSYSFDVVWRSVMISCFAYVGELVDTLWVVIT